MTRLAHPIHTSYQLLFCCLWLLFASACTSQNDKQVDVSKIQIPLHSVRFDQELFACDTNHLEASINQLGNKYPDFSSVYFRELTGFARGDNQASFLQSVHHFLTYKDYVGLYDTVQKHFPDIEETNQQLKELFQHIQYYYPEKKLGDVYYFMSGLNYWSAVTVDSAVGVGLDMYLGKNYPFYASVQIPQYQADHCEKEYIPVNVSRAIYQDMFPQIPEGKTLLDLMVLKGKEMLFLEYTIPDYKDETLIGYTSEQLAWCQKNEAMIWNYFSTQKLLYASNWQEIMRYVNEGPTSTGMPPESPGNIGTWMGWQIMRLYKQKHPKMNLRDIISTTTNAQQLIREIGYRPQ